MRDLAQLAGFFSLIAGNIAHNYLWLEFYVLLAFFPHVNEVGACSCHMSVPVLSPPASPQFYFFFFNVFKINSHVVSFMFNFTCCSSAFPDDSGICLAVKAFEKAFQGISNMQNNCNVRIVQIVVFSFLF